MSPDALACLSQILMGRGRGVSSSVREGDFSPQSPSLHGPHFSTSSSLSFLARLSVIWGEGREAARGGEGFERVWEGQVRGMGIGHRGLWAPWLCRPSRGTEVEGC